MNKNYENLLMVLNETIEDYKKNNAEFTEDDEEFIKKYFK